MTKKKQKTYWAVYSPGCRMPNEEMSGALCVYKTKRNATANALKDWGDTIRKVKIIEVPNG